jgi:hypothetical protein
MAIQTGASPDLEASQKRYLSGLNSLTNVPTDTSKFAPEVQRQSDFSMAAQQELARQAGLGAITFDDQGGVKSIGAGTGVMGFEPYLNQAAQYSGPDAYQQFMSPYQQDVIDTTLTEYDVQSQRGMQGIADRAVGAGAFGGGREGVERANYQTDSNRNRAALQAQLLGQGFGQAQAAAGQAFGQQSQLATLQPALAGQTVAGLQAAGSSDLAYRQAGEDARRQAARLAAYEPYERTSYLASGLGSLGGMTTPLSPAMTGMSSPQMSPLQTALSLGTTLGGIYGSIK